MGCGRQLLICSRVRCVGVLQKRCGLWGQTLPGVCPKPGALTCGRVCTVSERRVLRLGCIMLPLPPLRS